MFVGPSVSHIDWFVFYGVDLTPPRRGRAGDAPDNIAESGHIDRSAIPLPPRAPQRVNQLKVRVIGTVPVPFPYARIG